MDLLRKAFGLREDQEQLMIAPLLILIFLIILFALRGFVQNRDAGALTYSAVGDILPAASAPVIKDGTTNTVQFAGSYLPNQRVDLLIDGTLVEQVETDRLGRWTYEMTLPDGRHNLRLTARRDGLTVESPAYPFAIRSGGVIESDRSAVNYLPRLGESETLNGIPIQDPSFEPDLDGMAITAGRVTLTGTSTPGSQVIVSTDGRTLGRVAVGDDGQWTLSSTFDEPGNYTIDVRSVERPDRPIDTITITIGQVLQTPTIELVADRPDPNTVNLIGTGEPNVDLSIFNNGEFIGLVTTDMDGNWAFDYPLPPNETTFEFVAVANAEGALEPAISTPTRLRRPAEPARITLDPLTEESADFTVGENLATGNINLSGTGQPVGTPVFIFLNNTQLGTTTIDSNGLWNFTTEVNLPPGTHAVVALLGNESGEMLTSSEVATLIVPEGEPDEGSLRGIFVVIQSEENLR